MSSHDFDPDFASSREHAYLYRSLGWQAVPARDPRTGLRFWKRPAISWKALEQALVSDEQFNAWFGPEGSHTSQANIGVITGACSGNLFVVDLDTHKGPEAALWWSEMEHLQEHVGELETVTQNTGGGGIQRFYRAPDGWIPPTAKNGTLNVDIRGQGGFVIIAPSIHDSGRRYEWLEGFEPWSMEVTIAPMWFCAEIDKLSRGGNRTPAIMSIGDQIDQCKTTSSPAIIADPFGRISDGREDYMTRMVCARLVNLRREGHPKPNKDQLIGIRNDLWAQYEPKVETRIQKPETSKSILLDMEGRGPTAMLEKLEYLACDWDTKVAEMALNPPKHLSHNKANNHSFHDQNNNAGAMSQEFSPEVTAPEVEPADLWGSFPPPSLPEGLLPQNIQNYALIQSEHMGVDAGGLAMAALTTCAAAISDSIKIQVKEHDRSWAESARIWTTLVGEPSTKKSPIISQAVKPLRSIDSKMYHTHAEELKNWEALNKGKADAPDKPIGKRIIIEDITMEAAQEVIKDNPGGLLCYQDELSGFFGSMDKYSGAKGSAKDRAFWLQSFNGGEYRVSRINRGTIFIPNLSVCLLGGIQPDPIRKLSSDCHDDGLLQRFFPIVLGPARLGQDAPRPDVVSVYDDLVLKLFEIDPPVDRFTGEIIPIRLSPEAQAIRRGLEEKHFRLQSMELVNKKLAAHIGKYDGLFARLCLIFHCIEHVDKDAIPDVIQADLAQCAADFLHKFLFPHALAFYGGILRLVNDHDQLVDVAGHILAHGLDHISPRDLQRSINSMKNLDRQSRDRICEQLEALGWLYQNPVPGPNRAARRWLVNPRVHQLFATKAEQEKRRRESVRQMFADLRATKVA